MKNQLSLPKQARPAEREGRESRPFRSPERKRKGEVDKGYCKSRGERGRESSQYSTMLMLIVIYRPLRDNSIFITF